MQTCAPGTRNSSIPQFMDPSGFFGTFGSDATHAVFRQKLLGRRRRSPSVADEADFEERGREPPRKRARMMAPQSSQQQSFSSQSFQSQSFQPHSLPSQSFSSQSPQSLQQSRQLPQSQSFRRHFPQSQAASAQSLRAPSEQPSFVHIADEGNSSDEDATLVGGRGRRTLARVATEPTQQELLLMPLSRLPPLTSRALVPYRGPPEEVVRQTLERSQRERLKQAWRRLQQCRRCDHNSGRDTGHATDGPNNGMMCDDDEF
ncbi:MAG: hypothetical protein MHM6MM_004842 [Cercozoa sp. M6MM]